MSNDPYDPYGKFASAIYNRETSEEHERRVGKAPELGMGYQFGSLSFAALRAANAARCPMFKNAKGESQHSGQDWSGNDWLVATFGELGEAANVMKKVRRGDFTFAGAHDKLAREFSDVVIYLDLLAWSQDVSLDASGFHDTFDNMRKANGLAATQRAVRQKPNDTMVDALRILGKLASIIYPASPRLAGTLRSMLYCIDTLAAECGIDLERAVKETFNAKSAQLELPLFLTNEGPVPEL